MVSNLIRKVCANCGKEFHIKANAAKRGRGKFCSRKCVADWQRTNLKGPDNPNWRGGKSKKGEAGVSSSYKKGRRNENKTRKLLEANDYYITRSGASKGLWDLIGYKRGGKNWRCIQVKSNGPPRPEEMRAIEEERVPPNTTKEIWIWYDYIREPTITIVD